MLRELVKLEIQVANHIGQESEHATGTLEFRDGAPTLIEDRDQFRVKWIGPQQVIAVGWFSARGRHILTK